jgi:small-conductance mechanosensitive channel
MGYGKLFAEAFAVVFVLALVLFIIYSLSYSAGALPHNVSIVIGAVALFVALYMIFRLFMRFFESYLIKYAEAKDIKPVIFIATVAGYFIIGLSTLSYAGVDTSSILLSGTLISVVLGLATQTVLSNVFGGIFIMFTKPFRINDRVVVNTWQYGMMLASYPPKYLSKDEIRPSFCGRIVDISTNYTLIREDDGRVTKIPNGIIVSAAVSIIKDSVGTKVRYEVPKSISIGNVRKIIGSKVKLADGLEKITGIVIDEASSETYMLALTAIVKPEMEAEVRSRIIECLIENLEPLKEKKTKS